MLNEKQKKQESNQISDKSCDSDRELVFQKLNFGLMILKKSWYEKPRNIPESKKSVLSYSS